MKWHVTFGAVVLLASSAFGQALPAPIRAYLGSAYSGWKASTTSAYCSAKYRKWNLTGDLDGDRRTDHLVKIVRGQRGFILAFLNRGQRYEPIVVISTTSAEVRSTALAIVKKGSKHPLGNYGDDNQEYLTLTKDAIFEGPCASDDIALHVYQDGKFVVY